MAKRRIALGDRALVTHCHVNKEKLGFFTDRTIKIFDSLIAHADDIPRPKDRIFLDRVPEKLDSLWSSLLMDAIHALKIRDQREKAYQHNFRKASLKDLTSAREQNVYGITDLKNYFDSFTEYERVLYGAESTYRDHVTHVIRTWLIGVYLMTAFNASINDLDFDFPIPAINEKGSEINYLSLILCDEERWAIWTITALCHDLGYPLEKTNKINDAIEGMLTFFGSITTSRYTYSFQTQHQSINEITLRLLSSKVQRVNADESFLENSDGPNKAPDVYLTKVQEKYYAKFAHSLEEFRHGIVSCLVLVKSLVFFLETDYDSNSSGNLTYEDARQFYIRREILRSIAAHTCTDIYHLQINTISFILIVCDELQEWGRPTLSDMKLGRSGSREPSKVSIEKCDFENGEFIATIQYSGENWKEIENKLRRKFQDFHKLMRAALDDETRKITFKWNVRVGKDKSYAFTFDSNEPPFKEFFPQRGADYWDIYKINDEV